MKKISFQDAITVLGSILPNESLAKLKGKKIRSVTRYVAGLTENLGTNNGRLIIDSTDKAVGVTNFDKGNKLSQGKSFLVTGVRMLFDTTTSVTLATAVWKNGAPVNWINGELKISQNGQGSGDLLEVPITVLQSFDKAKDKNDGFAEVVPFIIRPEVPFEIVASLAAGSTTDQAYRLELEGYEVSDLDRA